MVFKKFNRYLQIQSFYDFKHSFDPRWPKIFKILEKKEQGNLLDIGCGDGLYSQYFSKKGYRCTGIALFLEEARKANERKVDVIISDVNYDLPIKDNSFNFILAGEIIEHTIDDVSFLRECFRVLKRNGELILTTPNLLSLGNRLRMAIGLMPRFTYAPFHYQIYNLTEILRKLREVGFVILSKSSSYLIMSKQFNKLFGSIGEFVGNFLPSLGEHLIIEAIKR